MDSMTLPALDDMVGALNVVPFTHPQGCRGYLVADPRSGQAIAIDPHLDLVDDMDRRVREEGWSLPYVIDTHTHADHPSGAGLLAPRFGSTRMAHAAGDHHGVQRHPGDGEQIHLGDEPMTVHHTPGHTPDHLALTIDGAVFSGDSLFIGGVARTDFLGGDAGQLFDSLKKLLDPLPDDTLVYPGHDYQGRVSSTLGQERESNPWLAIQDRERFATELAKNPPARPANMDALLELNKMGVSIPATVSARAAIEHAAKGGATSIIDVRTGVEWEGEHVDGSRFIPLDQLRLRAEDVMRAPAPRLIICRTGRRAVTAKQQLEHMGIGGISVIEGGIEAWKTAGGEVLAGKEVMSIERQVRIGAGALVLIALVLGYFVHPAFLLLGAAVGAGQVFAGVTDWCGMGLLLAKAPWNQSSEAHPGSDGTPAACAAAAPAACAAGTPGGDSAPSACAAPPPGE